MHQSNNQLSTSTLQRRFCILNVRVWWQDSMEMFTVSWGFSSNHRSFRASICAVSKISTVNPRSPYPRAYRCAVLWEDNNSVWSRDFESMFSSSISFINHLLFLRASQWVLSENIPVWPKGPRWEFCHSSGHISIKTRPIVTKVSPHNSIRLWSFAWYHQRLVRMRWCYMLASGWTPHFVPRSRKFVTRSSELQE